MGPDRTLFVGSPPTHAVPFPAVESEVWRRNFSRFFFPYQFLVGQGSCVAGAGQFDPSAGGRN